MKPCSLLLFFLACQTLGIVGSQIEIERIFFFNNDTYKLENMSFIIKTFRNIDICEKKT
jgi:hypothetical protein